MRATHANSIGRLALLVLPWVGLPGAGAAGQSLTIFDAVDSALARHPSIRAAEARVDAAVASGGAARSALLPGVALTGRLTRFQEPMVVAPLHGFDLTDPPTFDRTLVQAQVGARYTLFDGGERGARVRGAEALTEAARLERTVEEMELIEDVVGRFLAVLSTRAVAEASERHVDALEEERARAQRHLDAGTAPQVEVLRAEASLQDALAQLATARARVELAERSLARGMGVAPELVAGRELVEPATVGGGGTGGPSSEHPGVRGARRALALAEARLDQERAGRLPRLDAGAGLRDYGTAGSDHVLEWQAGVEVSWPLFTGGARASSVRRSEAEVREAGERLALAELGVGEAMDAALAAVREADARAEALAASVRQWEEVVRIEALSLESGAGVQRDFLRAQASLFLARAGQARARHDAILARVRLARAQGTLNRAWIDRALEVGA